MSVNIESAGMYRIAKNGEVIDEGAIQANYDGNLLNVKGFQNDETIYMQLDNDDIMNLLATPASQMPLENRLLNDFTRSSHRTPTATRHSTRHSTRHPTKHSTRRSTRKSTPTKISTISPRHTIKPVSLRVASGIHKKRNSRKKQYTHNKHRKTHRR